MLIDHEHGRISTARQCELLGLSRSSLYYVPTGESDCNERLTRIIDAQYTLTPFFGVPKMTVRLRRQGHRVNPKRIRRLMRLTGLEATCPKPRLSVSDGRERRYPYLLRGLDIARPNHVRATDIAYVRMRRGFVYLVAVMDWASRYVLSWELSITLDTQFCLDALETALSTASPEIFNTDQGSQFTSREFTSRLRAARIRISMDGRGRVFDNIFVERLWRSVKYEEVYLKDYADVRVAVESLGRYFEFYNRERPHQALGYSTPAEAYFGRADDGQDKRAGDGPEAAAQAAVSCRVGTADCSAAPLAEPDLWASHPALWVDIFEVEQKLLTRGRDGWVEPQPFTPERHQTHGEPRIGVGRGDPWTVAAVPEAATTRCRPGGFALRDAQRNQVAVEVARSLLLVDDDCAYPAADMRVKSPEERRSLSGAQSEMSHPASQVAVGLLETRA